MTSVPVTISMPEEQLAAIDAVCDEYSLARSRVIRDLVGVTLEGDELEQAVLDAIPESTRKLAEKERREKEMRDRQKLREKAASYNDRVLGYFRKRLEGDAAYALDDMKRLAEGYREDARIWHDDDAEAERKAAQVDVWLGWYEAGLYAREHAEQVETEVNSDDVSGWFEVGHDLFRLREHRDAVEQHIQQVADGDAYDADAVIDSVADKWSVCRGAVHLLVETMTSEGETVATALTRGGDAIQTRQAQPALEADDVPPGAVVVRGGDAIQGAETDGGEPDDTDDVEVVEAAKPDGFGGAVDPEVLDP